jgi:hypothetical protein
MRTTKERVLYTSSVRVFLFFHSYSLTIFKDYFGDASYQALVYWIMCVHVLSYALNEWHENHTDLYFRSALTNDPFTLARYAGFYKAIQSAGAAGSFGMDAVSVPYLNEHVSVFEH